MSSSVPSLKARTGAEATRLKVRLRLRFRITRLDLGRTVRIRQVLRTEGTR